MKKVGVAVMFLALAGCAGQITITRPGSAPQGVNVKTIQKSRDAVWNASVPALGKQFFVINNLDKSSGLINISYTGDPERYVDCGTFTSYVKNARGERTYRFPGASANQTYEVMSPSALFAVSRQVNLEGRVNLVFEEVSPNQTRVTANARYVVTRNAQVRNMQGFTQNYNNTISFNGDGRASFPAGNDGQAVECVSTGNLEREILSNIN